MATQVIPQDKSVVVDGLKLHYLAWGTEGKTRMLLLHGLRGHAHSWDDFASSVCQDHHVLALDQRGRGDSGWAKDGQYTTEAYVADLAGFCKELSLEPFILVGHSMGGRNAMAYAAQYPDQVRKLVLVDVGPTSDPRGVKRIGDEIKAAPEEFDSFEAVMEHAAIGNRYASDRVMRRRMQYSTQELPGGRYGWRYDLVIREERRQGTVAPQSDLWPEVVKIKAPTLIVRGVESDLLTRDTADRMVREIPDAALVEIPMAQHMVFEDNPDEFLQAVQQFL